MAKYRFEYSWEALRDYFAFDAQLSALISQYQYLERYYGDPEKVLFESILGQQVSNSMYLKLIHKFEKKNLFAPSKLAKCSLKDIQSLGLNYQKSNLLLTLSKDIIRGELDLFNLYQAGSLAKVLRSYHGIGPWTVDMLLLFGFGDLHILSFHDYGIRKAYQLLYRVDKVSKEEFSKFQDKVSPYETYLAFYFWELSNDH